MLLANFVVLRRIIENYWRHLISEKEPDFVGIACRPTKTSKQVGGVGRPTGMLRGVKRIVA